MEPWKDLRDDFIVQLMIRSLNCSCTKHMWLSSSVLRHVFKPSHPKSQGGLLMLQIIFLIISLFMISISIKWKSIFPRFYTCIFLTILILKSNFSIYPQTFITIDMALVMESLALLLCPKLVIFDFGNWNFQLLLYSL